LPDIDDLDLEEDFDDLDEEEETSKAKAKKGTKGAKAKPKGIGASAVAEKLGANPKTFRAWLRRGVSNGDLKLAEREPKARYTWSNWKDPELVRIMKAWATASHDKGGGKKGAKKSASKKTSKKERARFGRASLEPCSLKLVEP